MLSSLGRTWRDVTGIRNVWPCWAATAPDLIYDDKFNGRGAEVVMDSDPFDEDHERFRASVRGFVDGQVVPKLQQWDADRLIDRETWLAAGKQGLLGLAAPKEFGGLAEEEGVMRHG